VYFVDNQDADLVRSSPTAADLVGVRFFLQTGASMSQHAFEGSSWITDARADCEAGRFTFRRFLVENGLSLVILVLFLLSWVGQTWAGLRAYNEERQEHGEPTVSLVQYLYSGHFVEATSENWESEFLQMAAFVWLTSFLFQVGSPESKNPYEPEEEPPVSEKSPWPAKRGGWILKLYANSLSITFFLLFLCSFAIHVAGGARAYNEEQIRMGQPTVSAWEYLGTSQLWFESFQNWQSEFLSIAGMVIFAIFLRQKGSPESKPVTTPHSQNE
jgi:hypothetical protein